MAGYQTWVSQNGTTIIPSALSCFIVERTLGMTEIGGNHKHLNQTSQYWMDLYTLPLDLAQILHICETLY